MTRTGRSGRKWSPWAEEYDVDITSWTQTGAATLAGDGYVQVEQDNGALGTTYTDEYREIASSATFFSESAWNALTGQNIDLAPGTCANVLDDDGGSDYISGGDVTLVTNTVTGRAPVRHAGGAPVLHHAAGPLRAGRRRL